MKTKQIGIVLEQRIEVQTTQTFDRKPGQVGDGPWTEQHEKPAVYEVTQLRNAVVIDWQSNGLKEIRIGDELTEDQADAVARCKVYDVTVKR